MRGLKFFFATAAVVSLLFVAAPEAQPAQAQLSIGIGIGGPPVCPYGYYGYGSYRCAPYGYYGPEWFNNGVFIGAGRWYHGDSHFYGHVNRSFDPRYGYHGGYPHRGEAFREPDDHWHNFHSSHLADPHGHYQRDGGGQHGGDHGRH